MESHPQPPMMTNYDIKLLAAVLMLIDHVGLLFFPQIVLLRIIGRLSFPLFAWLLVQGERHTKDWRAYLIRLLVLGAISQIPYRYFPVRGLNILFTLALGLIGLRLARFFPRQTLLIVVATTTLAQFTPINYGGYGILLIWLIARFELSFRWQFAWVMLHGLALFPLGGTQPFAVFTPLIFARANHQRGKQARWFYSFYPLHLLALLGINFLRSLLS